MRKFISPDRHQMTFLPPSIEEWLPALHLARYVVEVTEKLDLDEVYLSYGTTGAPPYDPRMLLALIFYGYATGVFSSPKIEAATYDSVAFRYISGELLGRVGVRLIPGVGYVALFADVILEGRYAYVCLQKCRKPKTRRIRRRAHSSTGVRA